MMKQKMVGAYLPENYEQEIVDKLNREHPDTAMTHLIRALVGMWFDGKVTVTPTLMKRYELDFRKVRRFKPVANLPEDCQRAGHDAAKSNVPLSMNPHQETSLEWRAWRVGWLAAFNKVSE